MAQMTDVYHFELLPNADEKAFVAYASQTGFALASVTRVGTVTGQSLLREHDGDDGTRRYVWIVRWTLHAELAVLDDVPRSLWKTGQHLESQVELVSYARYVQVAESTAPY